MLLKLNPAVTKLNLYDIVHTPGVAADLSHCETASETTGFKGQDQIEASLAGAEIVVIPAGKSLIVLLSGRVDILPANLLTPLKQSLNSLVFPSST